MYGRVFFVWRFEMKGFFGGRIGAPAEDCHGNPCIGEGVEKGYEEL